MKLKFLLLLIPVLLSCKKDQVDKGTVKSVKEFAEMLKQGSYKGFLLPEFDAEDIPELLKYSNDTSIITQFPRNSISSAWVSEVYLGTYMLWNIESIRARSIKSELLSPGGFPSRNPYLRDKTAQPSPLKPSVEAQSVASAAYYSWWHKNPSMDSDPLAGTHYEWW